MLNLCLVILRCKDIERARSFYELFGMSFSLHAHGNGPQHYASEDGSGVFELYPSEVPDNTGLGFATDDLQAMYQRMEQMKLSPRAITDNPWGRSFVVRDPDGRRVEVKEKV